MVVEDEEEVVEEEEVEKVARVIRQLIEMIGDVVDSDHIGDDVDNVDNVDNVDDANNHPKTITDRPVDPNSEMHVRPIPSIARALIIDDRSTREYDRSQPPDDPHPTGPSTPRETKNPRQKEKETKNKEQRKEINQSALLCFFLSHTSPKTTINHPPPAYKTPNKKA